MDYVSFGLMTEPVRMDVGRWSRDHSLYYRFDPIEGPISLSLHCCGPFPQSASPFCRTFVFSIYCCFRYLASVQLAVSACNGSYILIDLMETSDRIDKLHYGGVGKCFLILHFILCSLSKVECKTTGNWYEMLFLHFIQNFFWIVYICHELMMLIVSAHAHKRLPLLYSYTSVCLV